MSEETWFPTACGDALPGHIIDEGRALVAELLELAPVINELAKRHNAHGDAGAASCRTTTLRASD